MADDGLKVSEVMRTDLYAIDGLASIADALAMMRQHSISSLVIEPRHPGDEYGFITVNEIASRVIAVNKSMKRTSVYEIMDKPILTVHPDMRVRYAVRLLSQLARRRALVRGEGGLQGFVSLRDLVLSYAEAAVRKEEADAQPRA